MTGGGSVLLAGEHSSEFTHLLVYHGIPMVLVTVLFYGAIFLIVRLAARRDKPGDRERRNLGRLNRQQRRSERAMKRNGKRQKH